MPSHLWRPQEQHSAHGTPVRMARMWHACASSHPKAKQQAASCAQFNCPVDVNWDYMDGSLLRRFWAGHPEDRAAAAPICDRILVYMRGITTVRPPPHMPPSTALCACGITTARPPAHMPQKVQLPCAMSHSPLRGHTRLQGCSMRISAVPCGHGHQGPEGACVVAAAGARVRDVHQRQDRPARAVPAHRPLPGAVLAHHQARGAPLLLLPPQFRHWLPCVHLPACTDHSSLLVCLFPPEGETPNRGRHESLASGMQGGYQGHRAAHHLSVT